MKVRLYVVDEGDGKVMAMDEAAVKAEGLSEDDLRAAFGKSGEWCEVELLAATHGRQEEAKRAALVDAPGGGFVLDQGKLPAARAAIMVEKWPEKWGSVSAANFEALHPNIANLLDALILNACYPSLLQHEGFMNALSTKRQRSEANDQTPQA